MKRVAAGCVLAVALARGADPVGDLLRQARAEQDASASVALFSKALAAAGSDQTMSVIAARERLVRMADAPESFRLEALVNALDEFEALARKADYLLEMRRAANALAERQPKVAIDACRRAFRFIDESGAPESARVGFRYVEFKALAHMGDLSKAEGLLRDADDLTQEEEIELRSVYARALEQRGERLAAASQRSVDVSRRRAEAERSRVLARSLSVKAPAFHLVNLQGDPVSLSDYAGKPVVLAFWATWCKPCTEEMPVLQKLAEKWQNLAFVTVSLDERKGDVESFVKKHAIRMPVLMADVSVQDAYETETLPKLYVIDSTGIIRYRCESGPSFEQHLTWMLELQSK